MPDDWAKEAEQLVRSVEQLGKELGALADEARKLAQAQAEAQAKALIQMYLPPERQEDAWRVWQRSERIAGTVADWAAQQGPWALAIKLWPEVKSAVEDEMRRMRGGAGSAASPPST
ncbi:MAG: hypothetical protein LC624_00655 [Halobacteriales archaeon]|nr:hypothetical protein [Halobacteriales archaeon]